MLGEKENYKSLEILEADTIKQAKINKKKSTSDERKNFSKPSSAVEISSMGKTPSSPSCKILGTILKMDKREIQMKQRTRKLIKMNNALYQRDDINRLHVSRKERGKGLANIEDSMDALILEFEAYIKKEQRKINYSDQKQHWEHKDQQNNN